MTLVGSGACGAWVLTGKVVEEEVGKVGSVTVVSVTSGDMVSTTGVVASVVGAVPKVGKSVSSPPGLLVVTGGVVTIGRTVVRVRP